MKTLYPHVFPMAVDCPDGATRIVKDHHQMSAFMGEPYGPDGKRIDRPAPPDLETVIAAGYSPEVAASIVRNEVAKAEQGIKPYGDREMDEFVAPDHPMAAPEPEPIVDSEPILMTPQCQFDDEPPMQPVEEYLAPDAPVKNKGGRPRKQA